MEPSPPTPARRPDPPDNPKWRIVICYWLVQSAILAVIAPLWLISSGEVDGPEGNLLGVPSVREIARAYGEPQVWLWILVVGGLAIAMQFLILLPVRKPRPRLARGVPLWLSFVASGLCGGLLLLGILCGIMGLFEVLDLDQPSSMTSQLLVGAWAIGSWGLATMLIARFVRRRVSGEDRYEEALGRTAALLFKGTIIEAVAIMPLDIMIRRKTDCYCGSGTFAALSICIGVGTIVLGPAALLPIFARRHKSWYQSRCDACGYDMSALAGTAKTVDRCPECGCGWRSPANTLSS